MNAIDGEFILEYHREIQSREQLTFVLNQHLKDSGSYLLRNSFSNEGELTVSIVHNRRRFHFHVQYEHGRYYFHRDEKFSRIEQLLSHYRDHHLPAVENGHIRLQHPIPSAEGGNLVRPPARPGQY